MEATSTEPVIDLLHVDVPRVDMAVPTRIIEDVCWTIKRGEFWAVGAMPGGGKTDLLSMVAGLQRPLNGTELIFGKDITQMREDELIEIRLKIGMVFGAGRLFANLTVAENLALPLAYHFNWSIAERNERVAKALEITELEQFANKRPSQILKSLHQRVGLARALALNPEIILLDNPLLMSDPRQSRWWVDFLCELSAGHEALGRKPLTVVVVIGDFRPWHDTARQFAYVKDKKFHAIGGREELSKSSDPTVRELLRPAFDDE